MFLYLVQAVIQKSIVFQDPWYFVWVLGNTIWTKQEFFIQSSIGILGWLDTPLPAFIYYGCAVLLGIVIIKTAQNLKYNVSLKLLILMTGICFGTVLGVMYHFYINGSPVAYPVVDSLQGRYILPILPFILLIISAWAKIALRFRKITVLLFGSIFLAVLVQSIFFRYYDYSRVFDTADVLLPKEKELQEKQEHTSITIGEAQSFVYEVKYPHYKIGGFQFLVDVNEILPVTVPYRYELKDAQCDKIIRSGYLDLTELHRPHIYTQILPIIPLSQDHVCLNLIPFYGLDIIRFLTLVSENNKPIVNFLYIKK